MSKTPRYVPLRALKGTLGGKAVCAIDSAEVAVGGLSFFYLCLDLHV